MGRYEDGPGYGSSEMYVWVVSAVDDRTGFTGGAASVYGAGNDAVEGVDPEPRLRPGVSGAGWYDVGPVGARSVTAPISNKCMHVDTYALA